MVAIAIVVATAWSLLVQMDLLILAIALVVILIGAELFTNAASRWFGRKLQLAEGAVKARCWPPWAPPCLRR